MSFVCLVDGKKPFHEYPGSDKSFSPDTCYPEYPFGQKEISNKENIVYEQMRELFHAAGYDKTNYGTAKWNPFGDFIEPGNTVLIKPNWVENKNKNPDVNDNLACLVTNPSVIRVIIDYVYIALKGNGRVIIGDAPMQGCDLENLFQIVDYPKLFNFYNGKGIEIEIQDFRKYSTKGITNGVLSSPIMTKNSAGSIMVDLGVKSCHAEKDDMHPAYKVTDYTQEMTADYHSKGHHCYEVNRTPIMADVIINVPKCKTHRLAGMTAAMKNFVGITYEKACLPHRIEGDKKHGGDAYLKPSWWKERMRYFDERRTYYSIAGKYRLSRWNDLCMKGCYVMGVLCGADKYRIGSWYGNDTIWRTAVDLNYILLYADKDGRIRDTVQRKIITIGDMFICGQKDGPVAPLPKKLGLVMISDNNLLFDWTMCNIMGFDFHKLPMLANDITYTKMGYASELELMKENIRLVRDGSCMDGCVGDFEPDKTWAFEAHTCWKGHVEK